MQGRLPTHECITLMQFSHSFSYVSAFTSYIGDDVLKCVHV